MACNTCGGISTPSKRRGTGGTRRFVAQANVTTYSDFSHGGYSIQIGDENNLVEQQDGQESGEENS